MDSERKRAVMVGLIDPLVIAGIELLDLAANDLIATGLSRSDGEAVLRDLADAIERLRDWRTGAIRWASGRSLPGLTTSRAD